jgi:hypothetical protein
VSPLSPVLFGFFFFLLGRLLAYISPISPLFLWLGGTRRTSSKLQTTARLPQKKKKSEKKRLEPWRQSSVKTFVIRYRVLAVSGESLPFSSSTNIIIKYDDDTVSSAIGFLSLVFFFC